LRWKYDGLAELDVAESILNSVAIYKKLRSTTRFALAERIFMSSRARILRGSSSIRRQPDGIEAYYFLLSATHGF
jgi:hypothetical protein